MPATALQERLASICVPPDPATERDIERLVLDYVDERKAAGWPVERIIIAMKQIAREAGIRPSPFMTKPHGPITTTDELLVEMVGWCIRRYYQSE